MEDSKRLCHSSLQMMAWPKCQLYFLPTIIHDWSKNAEVPSFRSESKMHCTTIICNGRVPALLSSWLILIILLLGVPLVPCYIYNGLYFLSRCSLARYCTNVAGVLLSKDANGPDHDSLWENFLLFGVALVPCYYNGLYFSPRLLSQILYLCILGARPPMLKECIKARSPLEKNTSSCVLNLVKMATCCFNKTKFGVSNHVPAKMWYLFFLCLIHRHKWRNYLLQYDAWRTTYLRSVWRIDIASIFLCHVSVGTPAIWIFRIFFFKKNLF